MTQNEPRQSLTSGSSSGLYVPARLISNLCNKTAQENSVKEFWMMLTRMGYFEEVHAKGFEMGKYRAK